jgi:CSLREA domain-containing protein
VIVVVMLALAVGTGRADSTITVNSFGDRIANDGECTLREAVRSANEDKAGSKEGECTAGSGADTIVLPPGVYLLDRSDSGSEDASTTGDLDVASKITIVAEGPGLSVIEADPEFANRLLHVLEQGQLTLVGVTLRGAQTADRGGAVYNAGELVVRKVTITDNTAEAEGGAIYNASGALLTVVNSTISGNQSLTSAGGIFDAGSSATLSFMTLVDNEAPTGAGLAGPAGSLSIANSIILGNRASDDTLDCALEAGLSAGYNLLAQDTDCPSAISDRLVDSALLFNEVLAPLALNAGTSETHALLDGSPAIDVSPNTDCTQPEDQRGVARPAGAGCDAGAYEDPDPRQVGPAFTVNTGDDLDDGNCSYNHCSLREAILAANARSNDPEAVDQILFNLPAADGQSEAIQPTGALPVILDPVSIEGESQPSGDATIVGSGLNADGLVIQSGETIVSGLTLQGFAGNGLLITGAGENELRSNLLVSNGDAGVAVDTSDSNLILANSIHSNNGAGVRIHAGTGNTVKGNVLYDNGGLGIDLDAQGVTANDIGDGDAGANDLVNSPVVFRPYLSNGVLFVDGRLNSTPNSAFEVDFYLSPNCDGSGYGEGSVSIDRGATPVLLNTDENGDAHFYDLELGPISEGSRVLTATATDSNGSTSEFSACGVIGAGNDSWPRALRITGLDSGSVVEQFVDRQGQSRWFKISIDPNSKVTVTLTNLAANYDLYLYKDIDAAYSQMLQVDSTADLVQLNAEFAPDVFTPDVFTPDVFTPDVFTPDVFTPDVFTPDVFTPDVFTPDVFTPDVFTPDVFTPDVFTPDVFTPDVFTPDVFTPDVFTPDVFTPDPSAFAAAQRSTLIGVSAFGGTTSEGIRVNTWNNSGDFFIRVRGRNGVFNLDQPFRLTAEVQSQLCSGIAEPSASSSFVVPGTDYRTLILADFDRMGLSTPERLALQEKLTSFAGRPEINALVLDLGSPGFEGVQNAHVQADMKVECPPAKNIVAYEIKEIVDRVWGQNPDLQYVVIVGSDEVIPFFRYPDQAGLANEVNYVPPVRDNTSSQASLKLSYVLGQDEYGSSRTLDWKYGTLPIPDLSVGRLVENVEQITAVLDAYMLTPNGVVTPGSSLVTGYDFLEDAANAVANELSAGINSPVEELITPAEYSPQDPRSWTAGDLQALFDAGRYDLIFLAGHFSASSALAADYSTRLLTSDITGLPLEQWQNVLVFSAGCHSGYNIVNAHGVPFITREPDWAQAFNSLGATLIGGTGYQYGDTDIIEYSERLYQLFSQELRRGSGPVSIGEALTRAKQVYLAETPQLRPLHEKAVIEATIFGLPMLSFDMPGARLPSTQIAGGISSSAFNQNPGLELGLEYADLTINPAVSLETSDLFEFRLDGTAYKTQYLLGKDGYVSNTAEPSLPLHQEAVGVPGTVLRGVGFRGGAYDDDSYTGLYPLVGSATTELRGAHAPFLSDVFYPIVPWTVNYFDALAGNDGTTLNVFPAQFKSDSALAATGFYRAYEIMDFRLYYSSYLAQDGANRPGLAAGPAFTRVEATSGGGAVDFALHVVGDPSAGIQEVWVVYTSISGAFNGEWLPLDLEQDSEDSILWTASLDLQGTSARDLRYMVFAVNGVGMVSSDFNFGQYFTPDVDPALGGSTVTALSLNGDSSGAYAGEASLSATLTTSDGESVPGKVLVFSLGPQQRRALTDSSGTASVNLPVFAEPGQREARVTFAGDFEYSPASASRTFAISRQATMITLEPTDVNGEVGDEGLLTATLYDGTGRRLGQKTVIFVISGEYGSTSQTVITNYLGEAPLEALYLPPGEYAVRAYFSGNVVLHDGTSLDLEDVRYTPAAPANAIVTLINHAPICSNVAASSLSIWSPDKELHPITIEGIIDPDGDPIQISITSIYQDEPVGTGSNSPDGFGIGTDTALVRAERDGNGNGRVYEISFTASDPYGGECSSTVVLGIVPHDQSGNLDDFNDGAIYDSTVPGR